MTSRTALLESGRSAATGRLQPRTYVDLVIDAVVARAAMERYSLEIG